MSDNKVKIIQDWLESKKALATILSIVNKENEVHPVTFYSCTFTAAELNYDTYNKEILVIFEAFKIW